MYLIRKDIKEAIDEWAAKAEYYPGGFVTSVLENNLREAFMRADSYNRESLFSIVEYCYNRIPSACWGSEQRMADWYVMKQKERENASLE